MDKAGATLDPPVQISEELLLISHQTLALQHSGNSLQLSHDVEQFRAHLAGCADCLAALEQAVTLYQGELLAGFSLADAPEFEERLLLQREMLHQQPLLTVGKLASFYDEWGRINRV